MCIRDSTKGVTISSTILPTNTGGTPTSYTISPNLLSIFHFGINNGMIGGTPSITLARTQFMITATNSGGSSVTHINVTINDVPPGTFAYNPVDMDLTLNQAMTPNTVSPGGGAVTSWEISPDVPAGLTFESSNGTFWGTPTVLQTSPITYTIWANNSGGSSSATVTITINDEAPGPFEYVPENNTWTNNSEVHLAPQFINGTTGNGSTWNVADINSGTSSSWPGGGSTIELLVGDTMYFSADDGSTGVELWAHDTSNHSTWQVIDIQSGTGNGNPGYYMDELLVGDTIYFDADDGSTGRELWAHDTSNQSTWKVADISSGSSGSLPGRHMALLVGDTIYFDADDGSTGQELWAHDTSNLSTWQVVDIYSFGHASPGPVSYTHLTLPTILLV